MKIVAIADTHGLHHLVTVLTGDVLLVAGDICSHGRLTDIEDFSNWLLDQPCRHKIVIAGNHDEPFQSENDSALQALTLAEAQVGAGTATVTRVLAERVNDGAAPGDIVSGSKLRDRVTQAERKPICGNPHNRNLFGHIHEGYGSIRRGRTTFINASVCDGRYRPINEPVVFDF